MTQAHGITARFADWAASLTALEIPGDVHQAAHRAMLDTLGVMIAGGAHDDIRQIAAIRSDVGGPCGLATGGKATAEDAALINGSAAHFWDFDDTSYTGIMHGSAVIFPTVLALAQETGASGEDARTAFIIGSEIAYVLADISTQAHYFHGWWSTVTFGLVGATAAAARLLGCDAAQIAQGIGLAAAASGGSKSVFGTHAKPYLAGETAQRAVRFARFVAAGLSGPADGIEDETGFLHLLGRDIADPGQADTLGRRWRLTDPGLLVKRNPVCSAAHAAIEEIARLTYHAGITPDDISAIYLGVPTLVRISLIHDRPDTVAQAQFSLPFAAACAILNGEIRLEDLNHETIHSTHVTALMNKTYVKECADLSTDKARLQFPESARVRILLNDQSERTGFCGEAYGMPGKPLSDRDFSQKFWNCLTFSGVTPKVASIFEVDPFSFANEIFSLVAQQRIAHPGTTGGLRQQLRKQ